MNNEQMMLNLCRNISYLRKKHNLSKSKMAKILGISVKSLNLIESGVIPSRLNCDVLYRLYFHFNISIKKMFEDIIDM